jgi:hypothetical protein
MKKACVVLAVFLGSLVTPWTSPTAEADPRFNGRSVRGRAGNGHSTHSFGPSVHKHGQFIHRGFGPHRFSPRHFVPFGVVIAPPVAVYSLPPVFYAPPPYYSSAVYNTAVIPPPAVYSPPAYGSPAPATPAPRIVEYPTGRYELRGDGIGTPYTWVWIPNPPPPPTAPPAKAPTSGDASPASRTQVYRWVDEQGVVHWTNRAETIPRRYRQSS